MKTPNACEGWSLTLGWSNKQTPPQPRMVQLHAQSGMRREVRQRADSRARLGGNAGTATGSEVVENNTPTHAICELIRNAWRETWLANFRCGVMGR
jgi:hypothetical protein